MIWDLQGTDYSRIYRATGLRGRYRIDLDQPPIDRWVIHWNDRRIVDDIYYVKNAQRIVDEFETTGTWRIPAGLRARPDGRSPHFLDHASHLHSAPSNVKPEPSTLVVPNGDADDIELGVVSLLEKIKLFGIKPDRESLNWSPWNSGLYCLLDTVFSAQSKYDTIVVPLLTRFNTRRGMNDSLDRKFSDFLTDVNNFGPGKFEAYTSGVMNRQRVGGRLKVEVAYNASTQLVKRGVETIHDLRSHPGMEHIVLVELRSTVVGIGPALANYFIGLIGKEDYVKLDVMILRFFARAGIRPLNPSMETDYAFATSIMRSAAARIGTTAARLDKAIWEFESRRESGGIETS